MRIPAVSTCALVAVLLTGAAAQSPAPPPDEQYLFIDAMATRPMFPRVVNFKKVAEQLVDAGRQGYRVEFIATRSGFINILLRSDGAGPRSYRLVANQNERGFLKELNEAAAQGFRVLPDGFRALDESSGFGRQTTWVAVMERSDAGRFTYSVAKGNKESERALAEAAAAGRALKGIVGRQDTGKTFLLFEEPDPKPTATATSRIDYRVVLTSLTGTLQKELGEAAAEQFRIVGIGAGYLTLVLARHAGADAEPVEYRLVATVRIETSVEELAASGAEGFRIAGNGDHGEELVFVLRRTPGTSERFDYRMVKLERATADAVLCRAEPEGYRVVALISDLAVLERH